MSQLLGGTAENSYSVNLFPVTGDPTSNDIWTSSSWTLGSGNEKVDLKNVTLNLALSGSDEATVAGFRAGKTLSANMAVAYSCSVTEIATGPVTIKFPADETFTAQVPDGASVLSLSTAVSLLAAASLALF